MRRISDYDVNGKKVLIRVDFNCAIENGKIVPGDRIEAHSKTIKKLAEKGAKVIVLAHQGRKDSEDFLNLDQHAELIKNYIGMPVMYVNDIIGNEAKAAIENLKNGNILLLENVRALDSERKEDGAIVSELSGIKLGKVFEKDFWPIMRSYAADNYTLIGVWFALAVLLAFFFFGFS